MISTTLDTQEQNRPAASGHTDQRRPAPRDRACPFCGDFFSAKGLPTHIGVKHKRATSQRVTTTPTQVTTANSNQEEAALNIQPPNIVKFLQNCRNEINIFSIIPATCRPLITSLLAEVAEKVVSNNDEASWLSLLSFGSVVLQMPSLKQDHLSLAKIVRENVVAFRGGARLEYRRKDHNLRSRAPHLKKRDVIRAAKQKLSEGDISSAARLLSSSDEFADEEQAMEEMIRLHPRAPVDLQLPEPPTVRTTSTNTTRNNESDYVFS